MDLPREVITSESTKTLEMRALSSQKELLVSSFYSIWALGKGGPSYRSIKKINITEDQNREASSRGEPHVLDISLGRAAHTNYRAVYNEQTSYSWLPMDSRI
jgi:hypothetical protein